MNERLFSPEALGEVLEQYRPWCRVYVRQSLFGILGRREDASDIIQSAWLDVAQKLSQFRGTTEKEFFGWLRTILDNNIKNAMRRHTADKRDIRREQDAYARVPNADSATIHWCEPEAASSSPSQQLVQGEEALKLARALDSLPEAQRIAVELRHLQGMKLREVCAEMQRSPDAVVSLIRRAMEKLSQILDSSEAN